MGLQVELFGYRSNTGQLLVDPTASKLVEDLMGRLNMTLNEVLEAAIFKLAIDVAIRRK